MFFTLCLSYFSLPPSVLFECDCLTRPYWFHLCLLRPVPIVSPTFTQATFRCLASSNRITSPEFLHLHLHLLLIKAQWFDPLFCVQVWISPFDNFFLQRVVWPYGRNWTPPWINIQVIHYRQNCNIWNTWKPHGSKSLIIWNFGHQCCLTSRWWEVYAAVVLPDSFMVYAVYLKEWKEWKCKSCKTVSVNRPKPTVYSF